MKYIADANMLIAVAMNEPEKPWLLSVTQESQLLAPAVLPFEIGNALSSLVKRRTLRSDHVSLVWDAVMRIPVELVEFDVRAATLLAVANNVYAYDGYYLQCALESRGSLLTLDRNLRQLAKVLGIKVVEQ